MNIALELLAIIGCFVTAAIIGEFVGYIVHWSAHEEWSGPLYRAHLVHHTIYNSTEGFYTDKYVSDFKNSFTVWMAPPMAILIILAWFILPTLYFMYSIFGLTTIAIVNDSFHRAYHLRSLKNTTSEWFIRMREIHRLHHEYPEYPKKNLSMVTTIFDKIFGTYMEPGEEI